LRWLISLLSLRLGVPAFVAHENDAGAVDSALWKSDLPMPAPIVVFRLMADPMFSDSESVGATSLVTTLKERGSG
jgi:hypothetical protein